ncbi:hypothetical protein SAMN04244560_02442 [Thermoanaerobacter thermohydrosulfuricus]|uniref:Uncharacterized protein n=2 Tax=Thermoanaerobacter thermohydrosulfuricus TaxID=1516 RepID=A0A1G7UP04_THETY|nr:hypothetical protein SAMN04244560_02442 [Thermoanaerobacter thermohydrosulfuricus]
MVVSAMSLKEEAYKIIEEIPEEKMEKVLDILKSLKEIINDELDEFDIYLIEEAQKILSNEEEYIPFEDVLKEAGIDENEL